jgi:hexulose-6-phosphate isomerase
MTPLIAVKLSMLDSPGSLHERFGALRDTGLDGVELSVPDAVTAAEVAGAASASGLRVATLIVAESFSHSLSSSRQGERTTVVEAVRRNLEHAHRAGADALMLSPGFARPEVSLRDTRERVLASLRPLADEASAAGVRLGIENLWNGWLQSPQDMADFVDDLGPAFGVHFDTGNAMRYGWPEHWIEVLGRRIVRVDVKDFSHGLAMTPATRYGVHEDLVRVWGPGPWGALDADLLHGDVAWSRVAAAFGRFAPPTWLCAEVAGGDRSRLGQISAQLDTIRGLITAASVADQDA